MLRLLDAYASVGLVVAGLLHTASRLAIPIGNVSDLWFMGTGLTLSLLGLLNLIRLTANLPVIALLCAIANTIGSLYLLLVAQMLPEPQVLVVLLLALNTTLSSVVVPVRATFRA